MPAYRSSDEADVRNAVVEHLRVIRPAHRIIHEINVSTYGPNRIDLVAVGEEEIIAVEVKSKKDKLDRLPAQISSMSRCSSFVVAALHEKFLVEKPCNSHVAHATRGDGSFIGVEPPESRGAKVWVFPRRRRAISEDAHDWLERWAPIPAQFCAALPSGALDLLWRDELAEFCSKVGLPSARRLTMADLSQSIRWHCTGAEITKAICASLRARTCVEADPVSVAA